jgi:hypothetical protein
MTQEEEAGRPISETMMDWLLERESREQKRRLFRGANPASVAARLERTLTNDEDAAAGKATWPACAAALSASRRL